MPSLTMMSIPEDLYQQVLSLAQSQQHSLEEFMIILLRQAVQIESPQLQQLLMTMKRDRFIPPPGSPGSLELLQEVRR